MTKIKKTDIIDIINLYSINLISTKEIAIKYNVTASRISTLLKEHGIKTRYATKYIANHNYFKELTPKKARMLGLLATDGDITYLNNDNASPRVRFSSKDIELINFVVEELGGTYYKEQGNFRTFVTSSEIVNDLKKYGITRYKSYGLNIHFNLIPEELKIYFLIGLIEGDGYVSKIYSDQMPYINICTASEIFANQILDNYSEYFKYIYTKNTNKLDYLSIVYYPQTTHINRTLNLIKLIILKSKDCGILQRKLDRLILIQNKYAKYNNLLL